VHVSVFSIYDLFNEILNEAEAFPETANLRDVTECCSDSYLCTLVSPYIKTSHFLSRRETDSHDIRRPPVDGCSFSLDEYFWFDCAHPTSPVHNAMAANLARSLVASPANIGKRSEIINAPK
jgi:phospholipase/lecithinase/hemolysin